MVVDFEKIQEENKKLKSKPKKKSKKGILKSLSKKISSKRVLKKGKTTYSMQAHSPAPYVNRYFNHEMAEAKRSMFLE